MGCPVGPEGCGEGNVCVDGECISVDEHRPRPKAEDYRVEVVLQRTYLMADRRDILDIGLEVAHADGRPFDGALLVRSDPIEAAVAEPGRIEVRDGVGTVRIRGCFYADVTCPPFFRIDVALDAAPVVVIGHSDGFVRLEGVPKDRPWIFGSAGGGVAGTAGSDPQSGRSSGGSSGGFSGRSLANLRSPALRGAPTCQGEGWKIRARRRGGETVDHLGDEVVIGRGAGSMIRGEDRDNMPRVTVDFPDYSPEGRYTAEDGARMWVNLKEVGTTMCTLGVAFVDTVAIAVEGGRFTRTGYGVAAVGECDFGDPGDGGGTWTVGACLNGL